MYEELYEQNEEGFRTFLHDAVAAQNHGAIGNPRLLFR